MLMEVNSPLADERARHGMLKLHGLAHALERWTWRSAVRVLPVTHVLAETVAAAVPNARIVVVPSGIVLDRFTPVQPAPGGVPLVLGFVGFVRDWHGIDAIIRAMADDALALSLTIVGDGPVRPDLERLADETGLTGRVRFTGVIPNEAVPDALAGFDIALLPKAVPYASPLKIFDYMAAARPIVAPDQPNIREVLQHCHTALLFDPADPAAMWAAIRCLASDPELRDRLGRAARAELEARDYTWTGDARRVTGLAQTVTGAR